MIKLFNEAHRRHVSRYHMVGVAMATALVVTGFFGFVSLIFIANINLPRSIRFGLTVISVVGVLLDLIILLLIKYSVHARYQKDQEEIYNKKREVTSSKDYRASLLEKFVHTTFDYHSASRRHAEYLIILLCAIIATLYLFDALYLWLFLTIPFLLGFGVIWFIDRKRKNDFIRLSVEGISFNQKGETGFITWDSIKDIEKSRHESGTDYLVKTSGAILTFNKNIEPSDVKQGFLKRFLFDYRYAKELVHQIRKMVPHVHYKDGI